MNKKVKRLARLWMIVVLIISCLCNTYWVSNVSAAVYYSCNDIHLDYKKGPGGLYGSGKNGYKLVEILEKLETK